MSTPHDFDPEMFDRLVILFSLVLARRCLDQSKRWPLRLRKMILKRMSTLIEEYRSPDAADETL